MRVREALTELAEFYHQRLLATPGVLAWFREKYGIGDEMAARLKIGFAANTEPSVIRALMDGPGAFTKRELAATSAFRPTAQDGLVPFFDGRIVFPYWSRGRVVFMIGRHTQWTPDQSWEKSKYKKLAVQNQRDGSHVANIKRTYDVYQDLDVQAARQSLIETTRLNQIASQALQNAVETANMFGKQAIRHADIAADALWTDELNPVMRASGANLTAGAVPANPATDVSAAGVGVDAQAVAAAVAKQVDATITPVLATLQQIVQALATATTAIGNVVNQAQPKTESLSPATRACSRLVNWA